MLEIKIGQRYLFAFDHSPYESFVGEVVKTYDEKDAFHGCADIKILYVVCGEHFKKYSLFPRENVTRHEYTYLVGQDKPND
jgi:hypothetical protein